MPSADRVSQPSLPLTAPVAAQPPSTAPLTAVPPDPSRLTATPASPPAAVKAVAVVVSEALRQTLPRQQPLPEGLTRLLQVVNDRSLPLPPSIRPLIEQALTPLLSTDRPITPQAVQQAVEQSGLLAEAKLLKGEVSGGDLKLNLLKLIQTLQTLNPPAAKPVHPTSATATAAAAPAPIAEAATPSMKLTGELLQAADSAVARIQTQQLESLPPTKATEGQQWQFEIPFQIGNRVEVLRLKIEQGGRSSTAEAAAIPWSLTLQLHLHPLGAVRSRLVLLDNRLSATFWAEDQTTLGLIHQGLPLLQRGLTAAGFQVDELAAFFGRVEAPPSVPITERPLGLLDLHA